MIKRLVIMMNTTRFIMRSITNRFGQLRPLNRLVKYNKLL